MHCHIDWHLEAGFAVVFVELPVLTRADVRPPPEWFELCPLFDEFEREQSGRAADADLSDSDSLSRRAKLAIGLGVSLGALFLAVIAACIWRRRHADPKPADPAAAQMTSAAAAGAAAGSGATAERRAVDPPADEDVEDHAPSHGLLYSPVAAQVTVPAAADFNAPAQMDARTAGAVEARRFDVATVAPPLRNSIRSNSKPPIRPLAAAACHTLSQCCSPYFSLSFQPPDHFGIC
jgi:hypothetical protein